MYYEQKKKNYIFFQLAPEKKREGGASEWKQGMQDIEGGLGGTKLRRERVDERVNENFFDKKIRFPN